MTHKTPAPLPTDGAEPVAWRGVVDGRTAFLCRTKDEIDRLSSDYSATIEPLFAHPPKPLIDATAVEALREALEWMLARERRRYAKSPEAQKFYRDANAIPITALAASQVQS